jgi:hypothetical protein
MQNLSITKLTNELLDQVKIFPVFFCNHSWQNLNMSILYLNFPYKIHVFITCILIGCSYHWLHPVKKNLMLCDLKNQNQAYSSEGCFLSAWIVFLFFLCKAKHKVYLGSKALKCGNLWRFGHTSITYSVKSLSYFVDSTNLQLSLTASSKKNPHAVWP